MLAKENQKVISLTKNDKLFGFLGKTKLKKLISDQYKNMIIQYESTLFILCPILITIWQNLKTK